MNNKRFFLKFGLLGIFLKKYFSNKHLRNNGWKIIFSAIIFFLLSTIFLCLHTKEIGVIPLILVMIISIVYGLFIRKKI